MTLYCCGCQHGVEARLTDGSEVYPHRPDLHDLPFWICDACGNYVGCHHKTSDRTRPLGNIPTPEIKDIRKHIHAVIDPIWKQGRLNRGQVYARMGKELGRPYHTGELQSVDEAMKMYRCAQQLGKEALNQPKETT